jgi:hypothetical protein
MAVDKTFEKADNVYLPVASGVLSGQPCAVGALTGVAVTDRDTTGFATVDFSGAYTLTVNAVNAGGNLAIAVGDPIYFVSGDTIKLSGKVAGLLFGFALDALASGTSGAIRVKLHHD